MYVTVRSWKSSITNLIGREWSELSALYFKKTIILDFVYTLSSANIDQSAPNLGKIFVSNRIWMSLIMGPIGPEQLGLFALLFDFFHSLECANINCSLSSMYNFKLISTKLGCPHGWLSGERVGLMTRWLWVWSPVEATFLSGVFSPLTSAEACEKSSRWLWKEKLC